MRHRQHTDARGYAHVYLSPHLDDAALSCGGAIACRSRVLVVTLCTAIPPGDSDYAARRAEDERAMAVLGADAFWADQLDASVQPAAAPGQSVFRAATPEEPLVLALRPLLGELARLNPGAVLHAPLGVGGHVDHLSACDAAFGAAGFARVGLYEDFPYVAADPEALDRRLAQLPGVLHPEVVDVESQLARKVEAIAAYETQLEPLFGGAARMREAVTGFTRARGGEREWFIDR